MECWRSFLPVASGKPVEGGEAAVLWQSMIRSAIDAPDKAAAMIC